MRLYERLASAVIGTPFQAAAEGLRRLGQIPSRLQHPELREIHLEQERINAFLERTVVDGMNCIDAGAHLGYVLEKIIRLSPSGRHIAIEPVPYKAAWLRDKFPRIEVHQIALGNEAALVPFFYDERHSAMSALRRREGSRELIVKCVKLDDVVNEGRRVGFVKIDVEGGEFLLFEGAKRFVLRDRPTILFESTRAGLMSFGRSAEELFSLLTADLKYEVYLIKDWLSRGRPLAASDFAVSMVFPFKAFNYVASPRG